MKQLIKLPKKVFKFSRDGGEVFLPAIDHLNWQDANYLICTIETQNEWLVPLIITFYNEQENYLKVHTGTIPNTKVVVSLPLSALNAQNVFLPRTPGKLKTLVFGEKIKKNEINRISIGTCPSHRSQSFIIDEMYLHTQEPEYILPEKKLVDQLGQYKVKGWTGKTETEEELIAVLQKHLNEEKLFLSEWSRYGGWKEKQFKRTGFFRTEHDGQRWWLIDPEGYAFWSTGLDCVSPDVPSLMNGLESFYEWLPDSSNEFKDIYYSDNRGLEYVDYAIANLIRVFGEDYMSSWIKMTANRLKQWGFNTVGNWSSDHFIRDSNLPYVLPLAGFPSTKKTIFRDFPDVYSQEYTDSSKKYAKQLEIYKDDQNMIGYFLTNEPLWAFAGNINLAKKLMENEESFDSKEVFVKKMKGKYGNNIEKFNEAWQLNFNSFEELLIPMKNLSNIPIEAEEDLDDFTRELIYQYTKIVCDAVKEVDQNHLNLGMRYAWISTENIFIGSELFDVFTLNNYSMTPNKKEIKRISEKSGLPVLIGEFHFGAIDVGLPATGLKGVASQRERGKAYRYYVENAAAIPELIGTHYFTLNDQSALGRFDGENFQIGVVDICHRPYEQFVEGIIKAHQRIYHVAAQKKEPYSQQAKEIPRIGF